MKVNRRRIGLLAAGLALLAVSACQTSQQERNAPGALPGSNAAVTPRLNASTYAAHAELLERRGDYERAAAQYYKALELSPDLVAARNRLGVTLNKLGRHGEASAEFRRALLRAPQEAYLHNNLGFSLYLENQFEAAERELVRALDLQPDFRRARMNLALVLARSGRYDQAIAEFARAGTEADAYYNVAIIQAEAGRYADAARSLDRALQLAPDLAVAREQLREIARLAAEQEAVEQAAELMVARAAEPGEPTVTTFAEPVETETATAAEAPTPGDEPSGMAVAEAPTPSDTTSGAAVAMAAQAPAGPPAGIASGDIQMASDFRPPPARMAVPMTVAARQALGYWGRAAELRDRANARLARLRLDTAALGDTAVVAAVEERLDALLDEVDAALAVNAPWTEKTLRELEVLLGSLDQPF